MTYGRRARTIEKTGFILTKSPPRFSVSKNKILNDRTRASAPRKPSTFVTLPSRPRTNLEVCLSLFVPPDAKKTRSGDRNPATVEKMTASTVMRSGSEKILFQSKTKNPTAAKPILLVIIPKMMPRGSAMRVDTSISLPIMSLVCRFDAPLATRIFDSKSFSFTTCITAIYTTRNPSSITPALRTNCETRRLPR